MSREFTISTSSEPRDFEIIEGGDTRTFTISEGVGPTGNDGDDGAAATVTVGTTTTGDPGTSASVTNSGTTSAAVLNFTIPRGSEAEAVVKSASFTAANDQQYNAVATLTVTDPTPTEGKGFVVFVRNGTSTIGGTAYDRAGTRVERIFHSGAWANYPTYSPVTSADVSDATSAATASTIAKRDSNSGFALSFLELGTPSNHAHIDGGNQSPSGGTLSLPNVGGGIAYLCSTASATGIPDALTNGTVSGTLTISSTTISYSGGDVTNTIASGNDFLIANSGGGKFHHTSQNEALFVNTRTTGFGADATQYNILGIQSSHQSCAAGIRFLNIAGYEAGAVGFANVGTLTGYIDNSMYISASPLYDSSAVRTQDNPIRIVIGQEGVIGGSLTFRQRMIFGTDFSIDMLDKSATSVFKITGDTVGVATLAGVIFDRTFAANAMMRTKAREQLLAHWKGATPTKAWSIGSGAIGAGVGDDFVVNMYNGSAWAEQFRVTNIGGLTISKTVTAGGTTGARTINKASGSVNFAAGATSLVVTNSLCTTSSVIICTIATNDATAAGLKVVAGSGSFTIYLGTAPTAETRVNFLLTN